MQSASSSARYAGVAVEHSASQRSQVAKLAISPDKWPNSRLSAHLRSHKEKKIDHDIEDFSRLFEGTSFASLIIALTISSPETQRLSPSKGRAT
jgi:hypothetical protein